MKIAVTLLLSIFLGSLPGYAVEDMEPFVAPSKAPLDPRKTEAPKDRITESDAKEIKSEFGGMLYMALKEYSYESWPGKEMSDCNQDTSGSGCYRCELVMGHARTYYFFYNDPARKGCTLQQLDAHFHVSDPNVLKVLKRAAQSLFGQAVRDTKLASKENGWDGSGSGWKWETDSDLAFLYMDKEQGTLNGQGEARFQWRRGPLLKSTSSSTNTTR